MAHAERLWTVKEAARYLGLKPRTLYNRISRGTIPFLRIGPGGDPRFSKRMLDRWLNEHGNTRKRRVPEKSCKT